MNLRVSTMLALSGGALLSASCSTAPAQQARDPKAVQELSRALQGRVAGPTVSCIPNFRGRSQMQVIDDWTILFRDGSTVYVQNPRGSCPGIDNPGYTLVMRQYGSGQLCSGEINQLVDLTTGVHAGSCVFSPFVPYRKPG